MSLSPLCPDQTTRFARQDGGQPPPRFPKALLCPGIAHHLSGPTANAGTQNPVHRIWDRRPLHTSPHEG